MEELITLHHGNFVILGKGQRNMPKEQAALTEWQNRPSMPSFFWMKWRRNVQGGILPIGKNGTWVCWNKCSIMLTPCGIKNFKGVPAESLLEPSETALEHPSMWTLVGSRDASLLQVAEQMYKGKHVAGTQHIHPHTMWWPNEGAMMGSLWVPDPGWPTWWNRASWIAF